MMKAIIASSNLDRYCNSIFAPRVLFLAQLTQLSSSAEFTHQSPPDLFLLRAKSSL